MSLSRKMARGAEQRAKAASRMASRPDRRAAPQRRAEERAARDARLEAHRARLSEMTPDERDAYNRAEDARIERLMAICGPVLAGAANMAARG